MDITINGLSTKVLGFKRAKIEKALLGSYNDMCDLMNSAVLPMYNHVWNFHMVPDYGEKVYNWPENAQEEYEQSELDLSMDIWTWFLQEKYGYKYVINNYYLKDVKEVSVAGDSRRIHCNMVVYLENAGE